MPAFLRPYILSFVPLFIAMGAFDALPIVLDLGRGQLEVDRRRTVRQAAAVAGVILVGFLYLGKGVFLLLGVSDSDFLVAGGLLLLVLSVKSLLLDPDTRPAGAREFGIVPLATPLIAGPAAMATTVILLNSYGSLVTLVSIVLNCVAAWGILEAAPTLSRLMGERGTQALAKVTYILLASIGVMMIRRGMGAAG